MSACSESLISSISESPSATRKASARLSPTEEEPSIMPGQFYTRRSSSAPVSSRASIRKSGRSSSARKESAWTNFPKLSSRASTTDWLTPLGLYGDPDHLQRRETISDLYNHGVDAHCGVENSAPLSIVEESPRHTPLPTDNESLLHDAERAWSSQLDEAPRSHNKRKMGYAIGSATQSRRSSVKPIENHEPTPKSGGFLDTLRRYSFMPLLDQTPENIRAATPPIRSWTILPLQLERDKKRSSKAMLQEILDQSPTSSKSSSSKSGSRKKSASWKTPKRLSGPGRMSCSEETAPHVCLDDQMSPWSSEHGTSWLV
ncbi:hypothetical protein F5B20DRAFT_148139 [Whalleya microplaca]|nr:hypothetical protein F5B20DRAFT_148139 [Whalleya microplaca]